MFCRNCGKQLGEGANFCSRCGTRVVNIEVLKVQETALESKPEELPKTMIYPAVNVVIAIAALLLLAMLMRFLLL